MAEVIFIYNTRDYPFECEEEDCIRDICNKFCEKIGEDINSFYFLFDGDDINKDLKFKELARNIKKMKILIFKKNTEQISESFLNQSILNEEQANQLKDINFEKDIIQRINEEYISKSPNSNNIILDLPKKEIIDFNDPIFKEYNYIITPEIKEKLCLLYTYMKNQIPCILEGETGTSKTFSTIILSKYLSKNWEKENLQKDFKVLRFNLSSESKASDLLGKYVGDQKSFAGIVFETGVFIKAFSEGHCLLLDEINLASPALFQCIEEALDTKILSIEVPGLPLKQFKMHKNFCLVATQNPNKGNFLRKRNELKSQILSRFQIISFEEFNEEELFQIHFKTDNLTIFSIKKYHIIL